MSENAGWIKLHRCLLSKAIWKCSTPEQRNLMIIILLLANHEPNQWIWKGEKFVCQPGQFVTSYKNLAKTADMTVKQIRCALDKFQKFEFCVTKGARTGLLITIVNWELYQGDGHKKGTKRADEGHNEGTKGATNKNDKNDKNDKKLFKAHNRFDNFEQRENVIKVEDLFFSQVGDQDEL